MAFLSLQFVSLKNLEKYCLIKQVRQYDSLLIVCVGIVED